MAAALRPVPCAAAPPDLPEIPGGWATLAVDVGERDIDLILPAVPDRFLDEPDVLEANRRDDYMPYWSYLWPAAVPMAQALVHAGWPAGTRVLELGSGVGLVGLAVLARGWEVVFSDYDETSLSVCRVNAQRNGLPVPRTLRLDWRSPADERFPVILGCEVIYDAKNHEPILNLLERMLAADGVCWIGDPVRSQAPKFYALAQKRGFRVTVRDGQAREVAYPVAGDLQIFELRLNPRFHFLL
jgi:predicted nicotinamide N-methyase